MIKLMKLDKIKNLFLNLFFPKKCLGCKENDTYLCENCFSKIKIIDNHTCFFCNKIVGNGKTCLRCQKESGLDRVISATSYADPLIRNLIKALKYGFARELVKPLSQLLIKSLEQNFQFSISNFQSIFNFQFLVVPIPLHKYRLRYRGFNQAELIAREIANYFQLPMRTNILKRIRPTQRQADLKNDKERKENIKDAFEIIDSKTIKGKVVLLIDDVITSGATLSEAAMILKQSGAKEVWALTIARG
jgi:ComF family protein